MTAFLINYGYLIAFLFSLGGGLTILVGYLRLNWLVKQLQAALKFDELAHVVIINQYLEDAAKQADLRAVTYGGEPTTTNERAIAEAIGKAIRDLKLKTKGML